MGLSTLLSVCFVVYGLNMLHLTRRAKKYARPLAGNIGERPPIAVHLPIYNEMYVVERLLDSCLRMADRYGKALVRICVIDDSDDETSREIDAAAKTAQEGGYRVEVLRRGNRRGFKAGALQAALEETMEPLLAVFDADFLPPPDFLEKTVPFLQQDERVGFVQCRWVHLDRDYNMITKTIALGVDTHFLLEQPGRWSSGYLMNFNGSAGLLRKEAILRAGGWNSDTLAEDLDVSYRMQLVGYRAVYLKDVVVPGELPPTISSFRRQQGRWARGSLQTARKVIPSVISSKELSAEQKFEASVHLTYYLVHPLMVFSYVLALVATFLDIDVIKYAVSVSIPRLSDFTQPAYVELQVVPWVVFSLLIAASTIAVLYSCVEAVRIQKQGLIRNLKQIILLVVTGYGISVSNTIYALEGLFSRKTGSFLRTPKYAIEGKDGSWKGKNYQLGIHRDTALEVLAAAIGIVAIAWASRTGNVGILPILAVYVIGYSSVLALTSFQTFRRFPRLLKRGGNEPRLPPIQLGRSLNGDFGRRNAEAHEGQS